MDSMKSLEASPFFCYYLGICWWFRRGGLDQISAVVSEGCSYKLLHKSNCYCIIIDLGSVWPLAWSVVHLQLCHASVCGERLCGCDGEVLVTRLTSDLLQ